MIKFNDLLKFLGNREKVFNSDHVLLFFLYWELRHQMHNGYLNIRSGHEIEVVIRRFL